MQTENLNEQGRSMVEMLGVLAVIGVLTVVGITGFRHAITKHRANELMNEASKRAAVVAGQLSMMGATQGSLSEFTQNEFAGGTFKTAPITPVNGTFKIEIDHVLDDVCNQMQGMAGGIIIDMTPCTSGDDSTILLTYNDDLSEISEESSNVYARRPTEWDGPLTDDDSDCSGTRKGECQVCNNGVYVDSDAVCLSQGKSSCVDGTCKMPGCLSNGDCYTSNPTQCGNGECYCNVYGAVDSCNGPTRSGTCRLKSNHFLKEITMEGHTYVVGSWQVAGTSNSFEWFSAKNFCAAYGKRMMTLAELGCTTSSCPDGSLFRNLRADYGVPSLWVLDLRGCNAYFPEGSSVANYGRNAGKGAVICY